MESWGCFGLKKDSQKQMPKIDFSKKGENTYFKTHNRLFFAYFFNRRRIWEALSFIFSLLLRLWRIEIIFPERKVTAMSGAAGQSRAET